MSVIGQAGRGLSSIARTIGAGARLLPGSLGAAFGQAETTMHDELEDIAGKLKTWAMAKNPEPIFAALRRLDPIAMVKHMAIVTRFPDVQEVLARDEIFHVPYAQKFQELTGGRNFVLGMQNTPEYTRDVSLLRLVIRREDIARRIAPFCAARAEEIVARAGGELDVVKHLGDIVPSELVAEYIGTPSPEPRLFATQSAAMSGFLFLPLGASPELQREAVGSATAMRDVLRAQIAARKKARGVRDDVLERMLDLQSTGADGMNDEDILDKLFGIVVAVIPVTSAAAARALDELLRRPEALARAHKAACMDDYATVFQFIMEALRFNPIGPGVFRTAAADYTLAQGTRRARAIPQGTMVLAALQSAMMDDGVIEDPGAFRIDRPAWQYMHFGYGLHTCFGQYINAAQLPRILLPLLKRPGLRRKPGEAGALTLSGPLPSSLTVQYDD